MVKKQILTLLTATVLGAGLVSCAHLHRVDGPVEKSEIPKGVRVGIGGKEVTEGKKVNVMKSICKRVFKGTHRGYEDECQFKKTGEALVLKVLDHDSAIVQPDEGVVLDTSMRVESQEEQ